jgi:hypothetical protein
MPVRRLLLLIAVLLGIGALAAAVMPRDLRIRADTATTAPAPAAPSRARAGPPTPGTERVAHRIDAGLPGMPVVRANVGDLVDLSVAAPTPDEVELAGLGRFAAVDAYTPAHFEFLAERAGAFPIRLALAGRTVGRLDVRARARP